MIKSKDWTREPSPCPNFYLNGVTMKQGIIIAGFTALGKTTLAKKYDNIIDLESSLYQWKYEKNMTLEEIENNKGKKERIPNDNFPNNYIEAIMDAKSNYDIVLTFMHWKLLEYFNKNNIDFYLAYPKLDSGDILKQRCIDRGNTEEWAQSIKDKVELWYPKLKEYNIKNIIFIDKNECLEDVLIKMGLIKTKEIQKF